MLRPSELVGRNIFLSNYLTCGHVVAVDDDLYGREDDPFSVKVSQSKYDDGTWFTVRWHDISEMDKTYDQE